MRPSFSTRQWSHYEGYKYLAVWQNAVKLREIVRDFTITLPRGEYRRKIQMDDSARSVQRNIEEGYKRPTTKEYLEFLGFSQGSLEEVKGDIRDCLRDKFITKELHEKFIELINKTDWLFRHLVESLEKKISVVGAKKKYKKEVDDFDKELRRIIDRAKDLRS